MKIVDLKCPSCGGKLLPVEGNSKIVCCEYCKSQFVLEDDRVINYHVHQYGNVGQPGNFASDSGRPARSLLAIPFSIAAMIAIAITSGIIRGNSGGGSKPEVTFPAAASAVPGQPGGVYIETEEETEASPFYQAMVEAIFEKSWDSVTPQELGTVKYLKVERDSEECYVEYSFKDPYGDSFIAESLSLPALKWSAKDIASFTGLCKLDVKEEVMDLSVLGDLKGLKGLACYRASFSELAQILPPGQLIELTVKKPESLEGIALFENLESLSLDRVYAPDFKQLVPLKKLKSLTIVEDVPDDGQSGSLTDYAALSVLSNLERLHLDSEAIREFSFLKPLSKLSSLSIEGTKAIGIEPLGELPQLVSLSLKDNDSIQDYSPICRLTGLKSLSLDKDTSAADPDLSPLQGLKELEISGFLSVSSVGGLGNLTKLSIHSCGMDEAMALSSLTGLEDLTCYSVWTSAHALRNLGFINGMAGLKRLSLCNTQPDDFFSGYGNNVEVYGDISNVFNHPGLEELYLTDCLVGIEFGKIKDNPSLKKLWMGKISVKENFYVEAYNGMVDVWYDDVSFDEHKDFLTHFPNLEELNLDGNQLTDIGFVSSLNQLKSLSIYDNYVTDLTPLNQVGHLKYLDVRKSPVSSVPGGDEGMVILQ